MARVVGAKVGTEIEEFLLTQPCVESKTATAVPIAIYVHRHGGTHARLVVVGGFVVDAVASCAEPEPGVDALHLLGVEGVEVGHHVVRERGLQVGITLGDDEWVRVVADVEQVGHAWLSRATVVAHVQVGVFVEVPAQVDARGDVEDLSCYLRIGVAHIFVVEHGALGQEIEADTEVVVVAHAAETEVDGLVVVAVFAELAQAVGYGVAAVEYVVRILHEAQHGIYVVAVVLHALSQRLVGVAVVDEGTAIVLAVAVVVSIAQLHIGSVGDGFAVGELSAHAKGVRRRVVVAVVLLGGALRVVSDVSR